MTKSSRECYNRPPLGVERQSLDVNQNPSTTHRLAIVGYSLDSISGHFIIQLGQLSHCTPQKRGLQSNWKLHTGPGGDAEGELAVVTPLSFFQLVVLRETEREGERIDGEMWGKQRIEEEVPLSTITCLVPHVCLWSWWNAIEWEWGINLVSCHGGKENRMNEDKRENSKLWDKMAQGSYTWGNNEERDIWKKIKTGEMHCKVKKKRAQQLITT